MKNGALQIFRIFGVDVYVHWSWLLVAFFEVQRIGGGFRAPVWGIIEYLAIFLIILLHEFGHALACKSVGGTAREIILWPLGGIAMVSPPPRPGPMLWSIAAGPLVNVLLVPVTVGAFLWSLPVDWAELPPGWLRTYPDEIRFLFRIGLINVMLLVFNLLPIYPLDGGQILQSLLWFVIGRARSLQVVSILGLLLGGAAVVGALLIRDFWLGLIAVFVVMQAWRGFQQSRLLFKLLSLPRNDQYACPFCGQAPLLGPYARCDECAFAFDTFESGAVCPNCSKRFPETQCTDCRHHYPMAEWRRDEKHSGRIIPEPEA